MQAALRRLKRALVVVGIFSFGINLLMLTVPIYTLQVYDRVLSSRSEMTLLMLSLVALGLVVACSLLDMVRARLLTRVAASFEHDVGATAFAAQMGAGSRGEERPAGRPLADVDLVRGFLAGSQMRSLFDLPWVPLWLLLLFLLHPMIGAVATGGAILLVVVGFLGDLWMRRLHAEAQGHDERAKAVSEAGLRLRGAVEAMGLRRSIGREWRRAHVAALFGRMTSGSIGGGLAATSRGLRQGLQVVALAVGAYLAIEGAVTPGVIVAASMIMARALAPIEALGGQWRSIAAARKAYMRVREMVEAPRSPTRMAPARPRGELRVDSLIVGVRGRQAPVLSGVGFTLPAGSVLGVMGRTGAGKSVLLQTLVGLSRPRWGMVTLDGQDIFHWDAEELGPHVGYLPEHAELMDGTVAENIARHGDVDDERVLAAARRAGVHDLLAALPDGYNTLVHDGGRRLSSGQRTAVAMARALYGDPALVVLDEPSAATDFAGERALIRMVEDLKASGVTTVIATRQASLLACADKLLLLEDGRMEMFGDREDLAARFPRLRQAPQTRLDGPAQEAA